MRQLVNDRPLRAGRQDRVEVHLLEGDAAILAGLARGDLEGGHARGGLGAAVGLDEADDGVDAAVPQLVRLIEHPVGFAYARGGTEVDFQAAALWLRLALDIEIEKGFGFRAL